MSEETASTDAFTDPEALRLALVPCGERALAALDFALEQPAHSVPVLRGVVERVVDTLREHDGDLSVLDTRDGDQLWIAVLLLAEHRDTASHEAIVALVSAHPEAHEALLDDLMMDGLEQILARTAGARTDALLTLLDGGVSVAVQGAAARALSAMAVEGRADHDQVVELLAERLVTERPENEPVAALAELFNSHLFMALTDLWVKPVVPVIQAVFDAELHDVDLAVLETFEELAADPRDEVLEASRAELDDAWQYQLTTLRQIMTPVAGHLRGYSSAALWGEIEGAPRGPVDARAAPATRKKRKDSRTARKKNKRKRGKKKR